MGELDGRVALVTGGGRGLGEATALALAEAGADVVVLGRSAAPLDAVGQAIGERGRRSVSVVADTASWEQTRAAVAEVEQALGPLAQVDPTAWARDLAVDLNGPFNCARAVMAGVVERGWGRILNVTSSAATNPMRGAAAYSVAKSGLNVLTRIQATELEGTGVVPIAVSSGMMDTDMQTGMRANPISELDYFREAHADVWLRPAGEPASLIRWLCGPEGGAFAGGLVWVGAPEMRARVGLPPMPAPPRRS